MTHALNLSQLKRIAVIHWLASCLARAQEGKYEWTRVLIKKQSAVAQVRNAAAVVSTPWT